MSDLGKGRIKNEIPRGKDGDLTQASRQNADVDSVGVVATEIGGNIDLVVARNFESKRLQASYCIV